MRPRPIKFVSVVIHFEELWVEYEVFNDDCVDEDYIKISCASAVELLDTFVKLLRYFRKLGLVVYQMRKTSTHINMGYTILLEPKEWNDKRV